jgi:hypothetical protein
MEIKTLPRKKGKVKHEVLVKQINEYLKSNPDSENERHKKNI